MRYLLDTNIFLWFLDNDNKLKGIRIILQDPENQIYVSVASAWEISIKNRTGKLPLKTTLKRCFEVSPFEILGISINHALQLDKLPNFKHHKDPFDRILVSQSKVEHLTLITSDPKIWKYNTNILKC